MTLKLFNGLCVLVGLGFLGTWRSLDCINKKLDRIIALAGKKEQP
jgi:hypothetical protein